MFLSPSQNAYCCIYLNQSWPCSWCLRSQLHWRWKRCATHSFALQAQKYGNRWRLQPQQMTQKRWGSSVKQRTTFKIIIIIPCSWFCIGGVISFACEIKTTNILMISIFCFFLCFEHFFFSFLRCFFKLNWTCWLPKAKMANAMISRNGCDIWKNPNGWSLTFLGAIDEKCVHPGWVGLWIYLIRKLKLDEIVFIFKYLIPYLWLVLYFDFQNPIFYLLNLLNTTFCL